jgi:PIN domain nuclease of toxin-antitoxin system
MTSVVLDTSAVIAFLRKEPGGDLISPMLRGAWLSAVNYCEIIGKAKDIQIDSGVAASTLARLGLQTVPFEETHALAAAALREPTRSLGLSLADRACLALGQLLNCPVFTADRRWKDAATGIDIRLIR